MAGMRPPSQAEPCARTGADLVGYADGELDAAHRSLVEAHLGTCPACQWRLATLEETGRLLQENTPHIEDLAGRAAIRAQCMASGDQRRSARPHPGLAVLALLLLLAVVGERAWVEPGASTEMVDSATGSAGLTPAPVTQPASRIGGASRAYAAFPVCASPRFPAAGAYGAARAAAGPGCTLHGATQCTSPYAGSYTRGRLPLQAYAGSAVLVNWRGAVCTTGGWPGLGLPFLQAQVGGAPSFRGFPAVRTAALTWPASYGSIRGLGAGI